MRRVITIFAAAAALLAMAHEASAQPPTTTIPAIGPTPSPAGGNGGLLAYIFDVERDVSLVVWLGPSFLDVEPTDLSPAGGLSLNYGFLPQFTQVFGLSLAENIRWGIVAADNEADAGTTNLGHRISIGSPNATFSINRTAVSTLAGQVQTYIESHMNSSSVCNNGNPCGAGDFDGPGAGATLNPGSIIGTTQWLASQLTNFDIANTTVGNPLNFFRFTRNSGVATGAAPREIYENLSGMGQWLLSSLGQLTYRIGAETVIPLPAALWLLISGIAGMTLVGRRRTAPAA